MKRNICAVAAALSLFWFPGMFAGAFAEDFKTAGDAATAEKKAAVQTPQTTPTEDFKTIDVSEIKPGMKGYGLTVFSGTEPEKFNVEVVDVIPQIQPGQDGIICKISGHNLEETGIAQGMSGSPVFLDGRLAGALSFGWAYAKGSMCGMTPIKNMIETSQEASARSNSSVSTALDRSFGYRMGTSFVPCLYRDVVPGCEPAPKLGRANAPEPAAAEMRSALIPLSCSGLNGDGLRLLNEHLKPVGMFAFAGGASADSMGNIPSSRPFTLVPGSALSVRLAEGDLDLSGIGTMTCFYKGKILAFGHGMFQSGGIAMPIAGAKVHGFVPSTHMSFKLGSPLSDVGALEFDGRSAIVGTLGKTAPMVPVEFTSNDNCEGALTDAGFCKGVKRTHHVRVICHPFYTGMIGGLIVRTFSSWYGDLPRLSTVTGRLKITLDDGRTIEYSDMGISQNGADSFSSDVLGMIMDLYNNPFKEAKPKDISIQMNWAPGVLLANIESIEVDSRRLSPGDDLNVAATLLPYQGKKTEVRFKVPIPKDVPLGSRQVTIGGYDQYLLMRVRSNIRRFTPMNYDEMVTALNEQRQRNRIYAFFSGTEYGMVLGTAELPSLSSSMLQVMGTEANRRTGATPIFKNLVTSVEVPYIVVGQTQVNLDIVRPEEK